MSKVLVAYASKHGSTAEIAEAVAEEIRGAGHDVDCVEVGTLTGIDNYDAVVLGSAVYIKRWRGDAKHFLAKHEQELSGMPFWVFSSGPTGDPADDDPEWLEPPKILRKALDLGVRDHVVFGGRVPPEAAASPPVACAPEPPPSSRTAATGTRFAPGREALRPSLPSVSLSARGAVQEGIRRLAELR